MGGRLVRPAPLKKGDKVALIAPSGPLLHPARLDFAMDWLAAMGLVAAAGASCRARLGYLAGEDALRAADVNWAFADANIKGIFCIRGGYGAGRILDALDCAAIVQNPKFFCGYSDVTALHVALNQAGLMTFHTPMLCEAGFHRADAYTVEFLRKFMFDEDISMGVVNSPGRRWEFLTGGHAAGRLCGGNLSVIASLLGTPYEIDTAGKILFLEDVGEEPYRVDRLLNQLRLAGKFADCAGVIFGDFTNCEANDPEASLSLPEIIQSLSIKTPILYNFACGHCLPTASLPLGGFVAIDAAENTFKILQN